MTERSKNQLVDSSVIMQHFNITRNALRAWEKKGFPVYKSPLTNKKYYYLEECEEYLTTGKVTRRKKAPK
jgi:DNA-binding transcriptional MerR regulator